MWNIMVIKVGSISEGSSKVQSLLNEFNCSIRTRVGLHEAGNVCGTEGLIILELVGDKGEMESLEKALNELPTVTAKMVDI
ncbi:MAG: hypothetical protein JXN65_10205 [Clostridia bacterium]|nr:hypothetical protein [Clostridia bacterium]